MTEYFGFRPMVADNFGKWWPIIWFDFCQWWQNKSLISANSGRKKKKMTSGGRNLFVFCQWLPEILGFQPVVADFFWFSASGGRFLLVFGQWWPIFCFQPMVAEFVRFSASGGRFFVFPTNGGRFCLVSGQWWPNILLIQVNGRQILLFSASGGRLVFVFGQWRLGKNRISAIGGRQFWQAASDGRKICLLASGARTCLLESSGDLKFCLSAGGRSKFWFRQVVDEICCFLTVLVEFTDMQS